MQVHITVNKDLIDRPEAEPNWAQLPGPQRSYSHDDTLRGVPIGYERDGTLAGSCVPADDGRDC